MEGSLYCHMQQDKLWTPGFVGMGLTNFFYFMSQYILVAGLPLFIMDDLGKGEWEAGLAMTFFQIGTVCARPLAGRIIDGGNKQRLLTVVSVILFLIMTAFFLFADQLQVILGLRLIHGVIFALGTTASATLAALVLPLKRKGEGIGYFAVCGNMAMVVGPLVGLLLMGHFGAHVLFGFLMALAFLSILSGGLHKLPASITAPSGKAKKGFHVSDFLERKALPSVILGGLVFFAYGGVLTFIPMYTRDIGLSGYTSAFFMVFALVIVATRPFVGYFFDHHGPDYTVYPGFIFFSIGFVIFALSHTAVMLLLSAAVLGIGFGALPPAFQTLAVASVPPARAGVATSTYFWSQDISVGLAAAILGVVAAHFGYTFMYGVVCLASSLLGLVYYFLWRHKTAVR